MYFRKYESKKNNKQPTELHLSKDIDPLIILIIKDI